MFQQENFIQTAIDNLSDAIILGFLLVVIILALFLFEWRVALISLLTIPLSITATLLVLYTQDQTINTMTLAGLVIALGALVDDAIIDVENIVRRLRQHRLSSSRRVDGEGDPRRLARGPEPDRVRDADHRRGVRAGVPPAGADRGVLPAAGAGLHAGHPRLAGGGPDRDSCAVPDHAAEGADRAARVARRPSPAAGLHRPADEDHPSATAGVCRHRAAGGARPGGDPVPGAGPAAALQGAGLPHALGRPARYVVHGDAAHHPGGQRGPDGHPRRPQLHRAPRAGVPGRRAVRRSTSARTGSASIRTSTTTRRSPPSTRSSPTIPVSSATGRPTWTSGPRRSSPAAASRSSSGCSAPTCTPWASRRRRWRTLLGGIDGVVNEHIDLHTDVPQLDVDGRPRTGRPVRPQAR